MKLPPESLTQEELDKLLASFPRRTKRGRRNRAMTALMACAGVKVGQVVTMQRRHYTRGSDELTIPAMKRTPEKAVRIDSTTREALDDWLELRSTLEYKPTAPMFPPVNKGSRGNSLH